MSAEKDLYELILVRWNIKQHWSPWNCVLLTTDEAKAHVKLGDPEKVGCLLIVLLMVYLYDLFMGLYLSLSLNFYCL